MRDARARAGDSCGSGRARTWPPCSLPVSTRPPRTGRGTRGRWGCCSAPTCARAFFFARFFDGKGPENGHALPQRRVAAAAAARCESRGTRAPLAPPPRHQRARVALRGLRSDAARECGGYARERERSNAHPTEWDARPAAVFAPWPAGRQGADRVRRRRLCERALAAVFALGTRNVILSSPRLCSTAHTCATPLRPPSYSCVHSRCQRTRHPPRPLLACTGFRDIPKEPRHVCADGG